VCAVVGGGLLLPEEARAVLEVAGTVRACNYAAGEATRRKTVCARVLDSESQDAQDTGATTGNCARRNCRRQTATGRWAGVRGCRRDPRRAQEATGALTRTLTAAGSTHGGRARGSAQWAARRGWGEGSGAATRGGLRSRTETRA
jgi:hypothetical protein